MEEEELLKSQSSCKEPNDNDGLDLENQIYESSKGLTTKSIKWISGFLLLQLLFDIIFVYSTTPLIKPLENFIMNNFATIELILMISAVDIIITYVAISFCFDSKENLINIILIVLMSLVSIESLLYCGRYSFGNSLLYNSISFITVIIIVSCLILYSFKTKRDFTLKSNQLMYVTIMFLITNLIYIYFNLFISIPIQILFSTAGIFLFSCGIIVTIQNEMRKKEKEHSFNKSNCFLISASINTQIVCLFLFIHSLLSIFVLFINVSRKK